MVEIKRIIQRIVIIALWVLISYILQKAVFSRFPIGGVTPNILLGVTSIFGFMKGRKTGLLVGFFSGLMLDVTSGLLFGVLAAFYTTVGFINGMFRKTFYGDDLKLPMLLIFSSNLIYGGMMYLTTLFTSGGMNFRYFLGSVMLPESVYTVLVSIPFYYLILFVSNKIDKEEKRRENHFVS